jgi:hypothetical protein
LEVVSPHRILLLYCIPLLNRIRPLHRILHPRHILLVRHIYPHRMFLCQLLTTLNQDIHQATTGQSGSIPTPQEYPDAPT